MPNLFAVQKYEVDLVRATELMRVNSMKSKFPKMRIIPIDQICQHEMEDATRTRRLKERILADGHLKNPVVVSKIEKDSQRYVLLDGLHRVEALRDIDSKDVVTQVVDYFNENIKICSWWQLISGPTAREVLKTIESISSLELEDVSDSDLGALKHRNEAIACLILKNKQAFIIKGEKVRGLERKASILANMIDSLHMSFEMHRVMDTEARIVFREQKNATAMLSFPVFEKDEIVRLAIGKSKLPAGITRHIIPWRALGLSVKLELLRDEVPVRKKNELLNRIVEERSEQGSIRFYPEPVVVFDD